MLGYIKVFIEKISIINNQIDEYGEERDLIEMLKREYKFDWEHAYWMLREGINPAIKSC